MQQEKERMEFEGEVEEFSNGKFMVRVSENYTVLCTISGKIRQNAVRILLADRVKIEVSPYDTTKGRIVYRLKE